MAIKLSEQDTAIVLAGLRLLQTYAESGEVLPQGIEDILTLETGTYVNVENGVINDADASAHIDALCEVFNGG